MTVPSGARTGTPVRLAVAVAVSLLVAAVVFVTLAATRVPASEGRFTDPFRTEVTLTAVSSTRQPSAEQVRRQLVARVKAAGLGTPEVTVEGDRFVVTVDGRLDARAAAEMFAFGEVSFRAVLDSTPSRGERPDEVATDPLPARDQVIAKLGDAYTRAEALTQPAPADDAARFAAFADLTPAEVAVLPPSAQFNVPTVDCAQLDARPRPLPAAADGRMVACERGQGTLTKYLLATATVTGDDVSGARYDFRREVGEWHVTISFTSAGQARWTNLTQRAIGQRVAVVADTVVQSAPQIESVIAGDAEITGNLTRDDARALAAKIKTGAMATPLRVETVRAVP